MTQLLLIARKECGVFFRTPFALAILPLFLILVGIFSFAKLDAYAALLEGGDGSFIVKGLSVTTHILLPYFKDLLNIFIFFVPLVTMRSFAEEKRVGTYDLLISYPLRPWQILLGKYLGLLTFVMFMLLLTTPLVWFCVWRGEPFLQQIATSYLGFFLFLLFYTALGLVASLLTENQFVAAILSYAGFFATTIFSWLAFISTAPWDKVFANFLLTNHQNSFRNGLVYLGDVAVFVCVTLLLLLLALRKLSQHYAR